MGRWELRLLVIVTVPTIVGWRRTTRHPWSMLVVIIVLGLVVLRRLPITATTTLSQLAPVLNWVGRLGGEVVSRSKRRTLVLDALVRDTVVLDALIRVTMVLDALVLVTMVRNALVRVTLVRGTLFLVTLVPMIVDVSITLSEVILGGLLSDMIIFLLLDDVVVVLLSLIVIFSFHALWLLLLISSLSLAVTQHSGEWVKIRIL
jgi:hypothetical protein